MSLLVCENIVKEFGNAENRIAVLKGVSLSLEKGELATILGSSGAGKSTLLNIIGALDPPSSGKVYLDGEDIYSLNDKKISALRNQKLGFVFQLYHLMAELPENWISCSPMVMLKFWFLVEDRIKAPVVELSQRIKYIPGSSDVLFLNTSVLE